MPQNQLFSILDRVESTNNYAMEQVHAGLASHGQAWFAKEQWGGKGQRGKIWQSTVGENVIMSIALKPNKAFNGKPYLLSATVAAICQQLIMESTAKEVKIKWPNDIYWSDRKAAGILIENIFKGSSWEWVIVGIGINVNQTVFDVVGINPTSLKLITNMVIDPIEIAKKLHNKLLGAMEVVKERMFYLNFLNEYLYKKNEIVQLKKDNAVFETKIIAVNEYGQLLTKDTMERVFNVGEVGWVIS
jgi:BirA family transcriptional regulator, biotin operon repressor / biotin---[acetyl-CoA-carboxylase] ligase